MWTLIKLGFFTFVAVAVGVFIGTVPIGGRTLADRIVKAYETTPAVGELVGKVKQVAERDAAKAPAPVPKARPAAPPPEPDPAPSARVRTITAGAANRPDNHTPEDRARLEQVIADRAGKR